MTNCTVADIRFCNLLHCDCCLYTNITTSLFQCIRQSQRVHNGCKHSDVVCSGAVHVSAAAASPEVAAADNDCNLCSKIIDFLDAGADFVDSFVIQSCFFVSCKSFTAEFDKHALIHIFHSQYIFPGLCPV